MRQKRIVLSLLLIFAFLLTACSFENEMINKATVNEQEFSNPGNHSEPTQEEGDIGNMPNEENQPSPSPEAIQFIPTPSPLFEQDFGPNDVSDRDYSELEIVTLLPPDAIPASTFPDYYAVQEANQEYPPEELVIGIEFNGDARAYSVSLLSRHEIVNDTVGGIHLTVTW